MSSSPSPPISSQSVDLTDTSLNNTSSLVCDYLSHNFPSSSFSLLFISTFRSSLFVSSFPFFIFTSFCVVSHPPFFLSIFHCFFLFCQFLSFPSFISLFSLPCLYLIQSLFLFIPSFYGFLSVPFHPFDPFFLTYRTQYINARIVMTHPRYVIKQLGFFLPILNFKVQLQDKEYRIAAFSLQSVCET